MKKSILIFFSFNLFFISCSKKEEKIPADIIPREKTVQVMVDIHLAEARSQFNVPFDNSGNVKQVYYKYIFEKHKISYSQLMKSWIYYSGHPGILSKVYDEVITELSKKQAAVSDNKHKQVQ